MQLLAQLVTSTPRGSVQPPSGSSTELCLHHTEHSAGNHQWYHVHCVHEPVFGRGRRGECKLNSHAPHVLNQFITDNKIGVAKRATR